MIVKHQEIILTNSSPASSEIHYNKTVSFSLCFADGVDLPPFWTFESKTESKPSHVGQLEFHPLVSPQVSSLEFVIAFLLVQEQPNQGRRGLNGCFIDR